MPAVPWHQRIAGSADNYDRYGSGRSACFGNIFTHRSDNRADGRNFTRIRKKVFGQCDQDVKVVLYEIMGGGHTWPGGSQYLPQWIIGIVSKDMNAGEVIWDFFERFSMQD